MGELKIESQIGIDSINRTIDEYRSIVDDIIQKEKNKLRQLYDNEANSIINSARQQAEEIIATSQKEGQATREKIESQAQKVATDIINTAKFKAQQIMSDAETRDKKEAKNRVKLEIEKLLAKAKEEYNSIILKGREDYNTTILDARKVAEKETSQMISKSREEAERVIKDDIAKARIAAQAQFARELAEAQKKAKAMVDNIMAGNMDVSQAMLQVIQKGDLIMARFKNEMQTELGELSNVFAMAKKKTEPLTIEAFEKAVSAETLLQENKKVVLSVRLKGEKPGANGNSRLFKGQMELRTSSAEDFTPISRLKDSLVQIPNIKYTGEVYSEDGTCISFDVKEHLPVLAILSNMPSVEELDVKPEGIRLVMKN